MKTHFLIFQRSPDSHSSVDFACAETPLAAMQQAVLHEDSQLRLESDGSVTLALGRREICYPHVLAYVEANHKTQGEWQIREIPLGVWDADYAQGFCGEDVGYIATYFDACRPFLRREFPRSRAKSFLWYLQEGVLVTFYKRIRPFEIQILRRYRHCWDGQTLTIEPWDENYDTLLNQLQIAMPQPNIAA